MPGGQSWLTNRVYIPLSGRAQLRISASGRSPNVLGNRASKISCVLAILLGGVSGQRSLFMKLCGKAGLKYER